MKKLLLLFLPLFFAGCSVQTKQHFVYCVRDINDKNELVKWEGYTEGSVCTFVINNKVYMSFKTPTKSTVILDLATMDCNVN